MDDKDTFRDKFPLFCDPTKYPDSIIDFWGDLAEKLVNEEMFGDLYNSARYLATCHFLTLFGNDGKDYVSGPKQSKTVGSVSVAYASTATDIEAAGLWNQTACGKQYYHLLRLCGQGCIQL